MKAISIRQPWAWLIVHAGKDIENRTWPTRHRGPVLIHAAKGMTQDEFAGACYFARHVGIDVDTVMPSTTELQRGGIVGIADLVDCVLPARRVSPWHMEGQFGFKLANVRPLPFRPLKGALGFFEVSE